MKYDKAARAAPEKSAGAVVVARKKNGSFWVLVLKSKSRENKSLEGRLVFPKGHIMENEEAIQAARRELAEETAIIHVTLVGPLCQVLHPIPGRADDKKPVEYFLFEYTGAELPQAVLDEDHTEGLWMPLGELNEHLSELKYQEDAKVIQALQERLSASGERT